MVNYYKEDESDVCPHKAGEPTVSESTCGDCPNRGTMWIKKNGSMTVACTFGKRSIKPAGMGFKADAEVSHS